MSSDSQHSAAILTARASKLKITSRPTPTPAPGEILIHVKAIALNPVDNVSQSLGAAIKSYPAIIGSDVAGIVAAVGKDVPNSAGITPGARVAAFAPAFSKRGDPDYGGFQERVLVPHENAVQLPEHVSFAEASLLPMSVFTAWGGLHGVGVPKTLHFTPEDKKGFLLWGASGSVGSATLQVAKSLGYLVYATASSKHHGYLKQLGAHRVFDYNDRNVVSTIVDAVKSDGATIDVGYLATGKLTPCASVIEKVRGDTSSPAKLSCAPFTLDIAWWFLFPKYRGIQVKFVSLPSDEKERRELATFVFGTWLKQRLESGEFVPSPKVKIVPGGLQGLQNGMDELKQKVSGIKLVVEL
ncbi:zinc-binding oxidoreductase-like protein CipB [Cladochytrium replicatum]|nr:zinc-binding oxidoreductase-like protein CipB [Cladochytrium replicatum]